MIYIYIYIKRSGLKAFRPKLPTGNTHARRTGLACLIGTVLMARGTGVVNSAERYAAPR